MQKDLKHTATITHIIKKLQPILHSFRYATKFLPTHTMLSLYYSQVFPHLIYGITLWGSDNPQKTYLQPLIRTQKKIIRLIQNVPPRTHTKPIMQKLQILNIPKLVVLRVCVEMHPVHRTTQQTKPCTLVPLHNPDPRTQDSTQHSNTSTFLTHTNIHEHELPSTPWTTSPDATQQHGTHPRLKSETFKISPALRPISKRIF